VGWTVEVVEPGDIEAIEAVRELLASYWESLGLSKDLPGFKEEIRGLPGKYQHPAGRLLLVRVNGLPAATAAFRPLGDGACEAKRLFVLAAYRHRGIATQLLAKLVEEARCCGYRYLYADTLPTMASALELYRKIGFIEVGPYSENPTPDAIYMRLGL
jgi:putative acetyltransferase